MPGSETRHRLIHYQFIKWPDHGVPNRLFPLVMMIVKVANDFKKGGIVIHCSAGIGRTGTVMLVLLLKEMLESNISLDPIAALRMMRDSRPNLIENFAQYNLSLSVFYEYLFGEVGSIDTEDYISDYETYLKNSDQLWDRLMLQPVNALETHGLNNIAYNRDATVLPNDAYIVGFKDKKYKSTKTADETCSELKYLNALSIDIEDIANSLIVTEHPIKTTIETFWKMIYANGCSYLIFLNDVRDHEGFPEVVPKSDERIDFDDEVSINATDFITEENLGYSCTVHVRIKDDTHVLQAIQVVGWKIGKEIPENDYTLSNIVSLIHDKANTSAPIVISCSDGYTACGLVVSAVTVLNRLQIYQQVNVYNSAVRVRRYRKQFIVSKKQFKKLYEEVKLYLEENSTYKNFQ